jgi:hypothetical protein
LAGDEFVGMLDGLDQVSRWSIGATRFQNFGKCEVNGMDLLLPYVPTDGIEPPWDATVDALDKKLFALTNPTPSEQWLASRAEAVWGISLHWLYKKKWNSKHKVPGHRKEVKAIEPFSEVLLAFLELAIQTHSTPSEHSKHYDHAADWFRMAAPSLRQVCMGEAASKTELINRIRDIKGYLEIDENPFPDSGRFVHLWRLIEAAIAIERGKDLWRANYWRGRQDWKPNKGDSRGVINALSAWATALKNSPIMANVGIHPDKGCQAQLGQGKGKITIGPKP